MSMTEAEARPLIAERYGIDAGLRRLATEKDDTFLVTCAASGKRYVAKLSNPDEDAGEISLELDALAHIARADPALRVPRVVQALDGAAWFDHLDRHGQARKVRLLTYLSGSVMGEVRTDRRERELAGGAAARLRLALEGFTHPCGDRMLPWDIKHLPKLAYLLDHVDEHRRPAVRACIDRFLEIEGELSTCRQQILHNDFTISNVLVDRGDPDFVTGVIDFGDIVRTHVAADVAVALLSQLPPSGGDDMLDDARDLLRGYRSVAELTETELRLLPHLVAARLCTRILITTWRARQFPDNAPYILRNMDGGWARLDYFLSRSAGQLDRSFF